MSFMTDLNYSIYLAAIAKLTKRSTREKNILGR